MKTKNLLFSLEEHQTSGAPAFFWRDFSSMHAHFGMAMFQYNQVLCETHIDTWQTGEIHISEAHS